jgi:hypothetical protein
MRGLLAQACEANLALEAGKPVVDKRASGESREYEFALEAGQYARLLVEQRTVTVTVSIVGPEVTQWKVRRARRGNRKR